METEIAKVTEAEELMENVKIIKLGKKLDFKPGQWIYVFVEKWGFKIKKPYTIFSLPNEQVELLIEDVGYVSNKLCNLKEDDELEISKEIFGDFTIKGNAKNIVFIAFDTGIAPFRSMIPQVLENNANANLIYLSERDEIIYEDYFKDLERRNKNFILTKAIGIKKEDFAERLKTALKAIGKIDAVYICGLIYLVESARRVCSDLGIEDVYFENWV